MALIKADRVRETTTTTGTGAISLAGASTGYVAFSTVCADGDTCYYVIVSQTGTEWETGLGTFSTPATFTRTTVHSSSNSGSAVSFTAGTKDIFIALTATQFSSIGTVTQVQGTGTINGITLTGTVTGTGNITLGGTLSGVDLTTAVSGILPVTNGGTGTATGSITGTGALTFTAGGTNENVTINSTGTGVVLIDGMTVSQFGHNTTPSIAIGTGALAAAITSNQSVIKGIAIGTNAAATLDSSTTGDGFVTIGYGACSNIPTTSRSTGGGWVAIGGNAMTNGADRSMALGGNSMTNYGYYSVAIGSYSLEKNNSEYTVAIGYGAANALPDSSYATGSSKSVFLGYLAKPSTNNESNVVVIGSQAISKGTNSTVIGTTSTNAAWIYGNTLNLGNGASAAAITANGALTITAGGTNQDVTLTPSGTGKVNAPAIKETVFAITDGSSVDINPANGGIQVWTLGANRTPTASSFAEGQSVTLMIDDGTAYAITWSSVSPTWIGGSAPTLATSGFTVIELWKRSSTIYGALVGTA